jgi:hypothetical protein
MERIHNQQPTSLSLRTIVDKRTDHRRYNLPTASEVALILPGSGDEVFDRCDIVIHERGGHLKSISELRSDYLPLRYPLLFPYGEQGWHENMRSDVTAEKYTPLLSLSDFSLVVLGNALKLHIMLIASILAVVDLKFYTMLVVCFKSTVSMPMRKLNRIVYVGIARIKPPSESIYTKTLPVQLQREPDLPILVNVPFCLPPSSAAPELCVPTTTMPWPLSAVVVGLTTSSP